MIKETKETIESIINNLPEDSLVIDIGAGYAPLKRANYILDLIGYNNIRFNQAKGPGQIRFNRNTYVNHDICDRKPFPFKDKFFDFSFCSHVLEDIRDPMWVCSEIIRISKSGYIEVPSRIYETCFNLEEKNMAGAAHHRWITELINDTLVFTFKNSYVHYNFINKNKGRFNKTEDKFYLKIMWQDDFCYKENWLNSGPEMFEYLLNRKITDKEKWRIYRKTDPRNSIKAWLSYIKNTTSIGRWIYKKIFVR